MMFTRVKMSAERDICCDVYTSVVQTGKGSKRLCCKEIEEAIIKFQVNNFY